MGNKSSHNQSLVKFVQLHVRAKECKLQNNKKMIPTKQVYNDIIITNLMLGTSLAIHHDLTSSVHLWNNCQL